jgi:hypothetical protein
MSEETPAERDWTEGKSEEEQARILLLAKETRKMVIAVAALAIGGLVIMVLFTILVVALTYD